MFNKRLGEVDTSRFDSLIGRGTLIAGTVNLNQGTTLKISGQLSGSTNIVNAKEKGADTTIIVDSTGSIFDENGGIIADNIVIEGTVKVKTLNVQKHLVIGPAGSLTAETIRYASIEMSTGAKVVGNMINEA